MSVRYPSNLPGGLVAVYAAAYGRRCVQRDTRIERARSASSADERSTEARNARDWHRMALDTKGKLAAAVAAEEARK